MTTTNTRRTFIKNSLLAAAAGISTTALAATAKTGSSTEKQAASTGSSTKTKTLQADIIVCGAGPAGIPAAIAAARNGARVILIEQDNIIGGAPVNMYVSFLCGGPQVGFFREFTSILNDEFDLTGNPAKPFPSTPHETFYHPIHFASVLSRLVRAEKNITLLTGSLVNDVIMDHSGNTPKILGVEISRPGGFTTKALAPITIDATGNGLIGDLAGAQVMYGRESRDIFNESFAPLPEKNPHFVMPCTLMLIAQRTRPGEPLDYKKILRGSGLESRVGWLKTHEEEYKKRNAGPYLFWGRTTTHNPNPKLVLTPDTRDAADIGRAHQQLLEQLADNIAEFNRQGFLVWTAPRLGIRESRRIVGDCIIKQQDLQSAKMPDDVISVGRYPLDIWGNRELTEADKKLPMYGIPLRSTIAKGIDGLLLAGKNLSASHIAMGAIRVQPLVAAAAEGTGTAAAMAIKNKTSIRNIDIRALQKTLVKNRSLIADYSPVS